MNANQRKIEARVIEFAIFAAALSAPCGDVFLRKTTPGMIRPAQ
jgi:hypothetical protein